MDAIILAAFAATIGFASGDVFTALFARRASGNASMLFLTTIKLALYVPFIVWLWPEFMHVDGYVVWWAVLLGTLFTVAYVGFNKALEVSDNPALVGVIAGCFPASAAFIAIVFLGQRPTLQTLSLLVVVLAGVVLIGLPEKWRTSLRPDKGLLFALLPLVGWGVFGALLHLPVNYINTAHGWFVVQALVAGVMFVATIGLYNKQIPALVSRATHKKAWLFALVAGIIIGVAEALQAFSLGSGQQLVIVEALLGSYPAAYFLIAHRIFREPLHARQWVGIAAVATAIILLSVSAAS